MTDRRAILRTPAEGFLLSTKDAATVAEILAYAQPLKSNYGATSLGLEYMQFDSYSRVRIDFVAAQELAELELAKD